MDAAHPCSGNTDCAGDPAGPVCDTSSGRCVQCLATMDTCPAAQHCDVALHRCIAGCCGDDGCATDAGAPDGGVATNHCDTVAHACVECVTHEHCAAGLLCVGQRCVPGCDTTHGCPAGGTCCTGACVDITTNLANCGVCSHACTAANGVAGCAAGLCTVVSCDAGFGDCDGMAGNGCEHDLRGDASHCGMCGHVCPVPAHATATCALGVCGHSCATGYANCDGMAANGCETNPRTDAAHCGSCGHVCTAANGVAGCAAGLCTVASCSTGFADCDLVPTNGCEVDLRTSAANCGSCGHACGSGVTCSAGSCCGRTTYTIPAVQNVGVDYNNPASSWRDNRVRAYTDSTIDLVGWMGFDLTSIPESASSIVSMDLHLRHEVGFGNPLGSPQVRIFYSTGNNWTRAGATLASLPRTLAVSEVVSSFVTDGWNTIPLNVGARDWSPDLVDNWLSLATDEVGGGYRYVYFFGTTDPVTRPYLTIVVNSCP